MISIIGANGTGKSNILSAIEKAFKGGIDDKRDNPKIDGFKDCKPELEIFIESYRGNIYKGKFLKDGLMFYPYKVNNTYFLKNYLETIAKLIFEEDKLLENRYYEITYRTHVSEDNISIMLKIFLWH